MAKIVAGAMVVAALLVWLVSYLVEGPLRRQMEEGINESLKGYSVQLREVEFHPIGLSVTLRDLVIRQDEYPDPPVAEFPYLHAHVHWRAVLRGSLVAEFDLREPQLHINLEQLRAEAESEVPVEERGWQEAVMAIYPLHINLLTVEDGELVYIDQDPERPLHLGEVSLQAENIRNVRSPEGKYPSRFSFESKVFETGRARVSGSADFLAEPHPGIEAELTVEQVELEYFQPVLARYNLWVSGGVFSATGQAEYSPTTRVFHLTQVEAGNLRADYVHAAETAQREEQRLETAREVAGEVINEPETLLRIDELHVSGQLGMVNEATDPSYRLFLDNLDFRLANLSNHFTQGEATARLSGAFMGSGATEATATFRPETQGPDFDMSVRIVGTRLASLNDLLRVYGNFDVQDGIFSMYSEVSVKNDQIDGYLKPLFRDLDVYDPEDEEKGTLQQMYEFMIDSVSNLLKNRPREEVATVADLSGPVEDPEASTWQIIGRLVQNAFIQAILPGFERENSSGGTESPGE